jgi:hypothetical protein
MSSSRLLTLATAALALAACQGRKPGASSADSHAPGTTTASVAADCDKYPPGAPGVIRTFCDGSAVVKVQVAGVDHTLGGGSCSATGGSFTLNLGVVSGPGLAGPKPDYFGLTLSNTTGHFTDAVLAVNVDGKGYAVTDNTVDITPTGGTFSGKAVTGETVAGSFTC